MTSLNEKKTVYKVLTKSGKSYIWRFTELEPNEDDYGNGIYIRVDQPSGDDCYIDCRYIVNYEFTESCVDFLHNWYGENLDELEEVEQ